MPPAQSGCPDAGRGAQIGFCEALIKSSNLWFAGMALTMDGVPAGHGILTVENEAQAIVRADPKQGNKGGDAARAALALLQVQERFA